MKYWIYKCNGKNMPHQVDYGDWNDVFGRRAATEWGSTELTGDLERVAVGDLLIAHQTDRNELVGLVRAERFRSKGKHRILEVIPVREIRAKVRPLKKSDPRIAVIPALRAGPIQTIYPIAKGDAERLLAVASRELPTEYYIVNTNTQWSHDNAQDYMLKKQRAAVFFSPWKYEIDRVKAGDIVFLYQSGLGIVAVGRASGRLDCHSFGKGKHREQDGARSVKLLDFQLVQPAIPASAICAVSKYAADTGIVFRRSVTHIHPEAGRRLYQLALVGRATLGSR